MSDIIAIIPARSGSKSILDKNIRLLSGHPLIAYSIAIAKLSDRIDRVIISTDSQDYADIAAKYGAEVPFIRPEKYANDTSIDRDFLLHAMTWMQENEHQVPEYWVHLRPTTPLRSVKFVDQAIDLIKNNNHATSLRSGYKIPESPMKWFKIDAQGYLKGVNSDTDDKEIYNLPKEAFDDVYIPDGYVDVLKASYVMNNKMIHGNKMMAFKSPVTTEVDSIEEFDYIQYQISKNGSALLDYLEQCINKEY